MKSVFLIVNFLTILTNNATKVQKGCIVTIVARTKAENVIKTLWKLPEQERNKIEEVTLDLASNMQMIVKGSFQEAVSVTDRFHQHLQCIIANS